MLPATLALVDDDHDYARFLAEHLRGLGVRVDVFGDSDDLLVHAEPYAYDFYVVDLSLPGVHGLELIRMLRRRSRAGVVVVSGSPEPGSFGATMDLGADMYLAKPVQFEQVSQVIAAVHRRAAASGPTAAAAWKVDRRAMQLVAPDLARIDLSETDLAVLECFAAANGDVVPRETLAARLGRQADGPGDGLNAVIFRLRRRIERVTPVVVPLQTRARVGYVFRAPLSVA